MLGVTRMFVSGLHSTGLGAILAGMLGVSAMAVQNALGHVSLTGAPPTAA